MDNNAITKIVFGVRYDHVREEGQKVKGVGSSTSSTAASHASFASRSSFVGPIHVELATARADTTVSEVARCHGAIDEPINCSTAVSDASSLVSRSLPAISQF